MKIAHSKKKFYNEATRPTKHKQTNKKPTTFSETEYFPFEKKNRSRSDSKQANFLPPGWTGNAKNLKGAGNTKGTSRDEPRSTPEMSHVDEVVNRKKRLAP